MSAMEKGIRADMSAMEKSIRSDMSAMEKGIRADIRTLLVATISMHGITLAAVAAMIKFL
jgi:hypothetical protein